MLRSGKLNAIARYIDSEEGFFPNTVILNFQKRLEWRQKASLGDVGTGVVRLPPYYACAWVIDGQHRLYGAARAQTGIVLPVLAFEGMEPSRQANLFVDINKRQTSVPGNLLWDLYTDIYHDSGEPREEALCQVAQIAKTLNSKGALKGLIDMPSRPSPERDHLTMTTVCVTIHRYLPWSILKAPGGAESAARRVARVVDNYYAVMKELWPEDWALKEGSVLKSNNGFGVFVMVLSDIVRHLVVYEAREDLLGSAKATEFRRELKRFLRPVVEYLKVEDVIASQIRSNTGRGPQNDNAQLLDVKIQDHVKDFSPPRLRDREVRRPQGKSVAEAALAQKVEMAEEALREFVLDELRRFYGAKWWRQGLPAGPKKKADREWAREVQRKPHLKHEKKGNERKFAYLALGDLIDVIVCSDNWEGIFADAFGGPEDVRRRVNDVSALRNPLKHGRPVDQQDSADGTAGLLWLSRCLARKELNPYVT